MHTHDVRAMQDRNRYRRRRGEPRLFGAAGLSQETFARRAAENREIERTQIPQTVQNQRVLFLAFAKSEILTSASL